jgi:hypothetical protein
MTTPELEETPQLIAQSGPLNGQRWNLDRSVVIGRESGCEVMIPNRMVSRFHARITPTGAGIVLEDLGSKNGTHLNGELVTSQVVLQDGDIIQVALAQQFTFLYSDATMPLADVKDPGLSTLRLDVRSRSVWVNNQELVPPLSALQFHVLKVLYENQGKVVSRQQLVNDAWGEEQAIGVSDQALDALLRRLRDRIALVDTRHEYLVTVRGHGIRFENPIRSG